MAFATSKGSDQPCVYVQTDQSICLSLEYSIKLLTEHHLEFLCLTGGCTGSSESTLVKMPHCWKSRVAAHIPFGLRCPQSVKAICHCAQTAQSWHDGCSSIGHYNEQILPFQPPGTLFCALVDYNQQAMTALFEYCAL